MNQNDLLRELVHEDSPDGFELFYTAIHNRTLPPHVRDWVKALYRAKAHKKFSVIKAFVGSWKTAALTIAFCLYRIGLEPNKRNLIIMANEDKANQTAAKIADVIENNPGWKICFPNVVPDKVKWSSSGYEVMRTDMNYGEWRRECPRDPCFVGLGYASQGLQGMHPTGCLFMDDLNTEDNTRSERERANVNNILTKTVLSRIVPSTWVVGIGTPWREDDALAYLEGTGEFESWYTPVMKNDIPVWPEEYPLEKIEQQKKIQGPVGFALTFLLDMSKASGTILKREWIHHYPFDKIDASWPVVMGIDYASKNDPTKDSKRDYFALAVMRLLPQGGLVLVDGFRGQISTMEAETKVVQFSQQYPNYSYIYCEELGKGEEFYWSLMRDTSVKVFPRKVENKSKDFRFTKMMAPMFETSRVWVSDAPNEFLNRFEREWVEWDGSNHAKDDTIDAVFHATMAGIGNVGNIFGETTITSDKKIAKKSRHWSVDLATARYV